MGTLRVWVLVAAPLMLFGCTSGDSGSGKCGPGTLGTSCQATADCECPLQCYNGACLETPLATGNDGDPDAEGNTSADAGTPGRSADAGRGADAGTSSGNDTSGDTGSDNDAGSSDEGDTTVDGDDDVVEADVDESDVDEPDVDESDVDESDVDEPDMMMPDMDEPDMSEPDMGEPDTAKPDTFTIEVSPADAGTPDIMKIDTGGPSGKENLCEGASMPTGKGKAFKGLTYTAENTGTTYEFSCTKCPGGKALIDGSYRYFKDDPSLVNFDAQDVISFVGNIFNIKKNLGNTTGLIFGYYFCADHDELWDFLVPKFFNTMMVFEITAPPFAWTGFAKPGFVNNCYLEPNNDGTVLGLFCNPNWNPGAGLGPTMKYCKIGSMVNGKECVDPF